MVPALPAFRVGGGPRLGLHLGAVPQLSLLNAYLRYEPFFGDGSVGGGLRIAPTFGEPTFGNGCR